MKAFCFDQKPHCVPVFFRCTALATYISCVATDTKNEVSGYMHLPRSPHFLQPCAYKPYPEPCGAFLRNNFKESYWSYITFFASTLPNLLSTPLLWYMLVVDTGCETKRS